MKQVLLIMHKFVIVPRSEHLDILTEPIVYSLKKSVNKIVQGNASTGSPGRYAVTKRILHGRKKFGNDDNLVVATHSLLRRMIAMIAGHTRRSWIFARGLHALGYLLEPILPHLNPLRHVAHRGVFCEEQESTGMKTCNYSMP